MGIAERKEREKLELRQRILQAAEELFLEEGFEQTSMRKIGKRIEYSPGTIYNHFATKDEIFYALHERYFAIFNQHLAPLRNIKHPVERLHALGRAYIKFAIENPAYYDMMFLHPAPLKPIEGESWHAPDETFGFLQETVQDCIDQGYFEPRPLPELLMMIWSCVHGMVSLEIRCRIPMFPEDGREELMERTSTMMTDLLMKR